MTEELIATIVGAIVSIGLEIIPGLKDKWADWEWKPMAMFTLFMSVPLVANLLGCQVGLELPFPVDCTVMGYLNALILGFMAFMGNQITFFVATHRFSNARKRQI